MKSLQEQEFASLLLIHKMVNDSYKAKTQCKADD